jgi:hypothetical protein
LNSDSFASLIQVLFRNPDFFPFLLQQQLTILDFVSYCGGSFGLFLGFSALSAIEIVYYFTLKLVCLKKKKNQVDVAISSEVVEKRNYLVNFMESSSIHGFNHTVKRERHFSEK